MLKVVGASWNKIRASTWIIGIVFVFGIIVVILGELGQSDEDGNWAATVYWSKESGFEIAFWGQGKKIEEIPKGVARAYYQPHINTTGWAVLDIETQPEYPDWVQAFGAGMLEGSLSWQMIDWQRLNVIENNCRFDEELCNIVKEYIENNIQWVRQMCKNKTDPYWHQIHLFYMQLEGVQRGFEQGVKRSRAHDVKKMTLEDFLWLNALSDIEDLKYKFSDSDHKKIINILPDSALLQKLKLKRSISYSYQQQNLRSTVKKIDNERNKGYQCGEENLSLASAFVKLVPDEGKLFIAHNSAGHYSYMLKMLKHYNFHYRKSKRIRELVPGKKITFSSYPGVIYSIDDYFILRNDITQQEFVVTGTPLPVFNTELWYRLSPAGQVMIGPRIMTANRLGSNGMEWASILSKYNSGTGNRQWIFADIMKFEKITLLKEKNEEMYRSQLDNAEGLIYVAEQMPGAFHVEDATEILTNTTYWASYGIPIFENIANISGVNEMVEKFGDLYSYEETPVAKIFHRDHVNATDMKSIAELMRSNFYKTDPFSYKNPRCAIGSRGDLETETQEAAPVGVTDTKIFSTRDVTPGPNKGGSDNFINKSKKIPFQGSFQIKAGPPYSDTWNVLNRTRTFDNNLGPFVWPKSKFYEVTHVGQPDTWNFEPLIIF